MKKFKIILLTLAFVSFYSCHEENDELTENPVQGGLVSLNNAAIGYVVGNDATYTASGSVYQGREATTQIQVYKSFTSSATSGTTNEELLTTITVDNQNQGQSGTFDFSFTYEELIAGLTLDGSPLPSDDAELEIGDFWNLRYVSTLSNGQEHSNRNTTKVSVGTRFAGTYDVIVGDYWRIGVFRDDVEWPAEMLIESVDAITYRVVEYFGAFNGNEYYFQIDAMDRITYPDTTPSGDPQTGNGQPFTTCEANPGDLSNVPCGDVSNYVERDDVEGKDTLYMTFGYFTDGSGAREFYQVLQKQVD